MIKILINIDQVYVLQRLNTDMYLQSCNIVSHKYIRDTLVRDGLSVRRPPNKKLIC